MPRKPAGQSVTKEDIIQAAAGVLKQKGYEATTMNDIAAAVDLTAASLYHHFENKNALLLAVLEGGITHVLNRIEPIAQRDDPAAQRLREMIAVHITILTENTTVGAAMVFEIGSLLGIKAPAAGKSSRDFATRREAFISRRDAFEQHFQQVVQQGIAAGEFRAVDVPIFVKTMLGAHNWVSVWYRPGGRLDGGTIADCMADTFLRALEPERGG